MAFLARSVVLVSCVGGAAITGVTAKGAFLRVVDPEWERTHAVAAAGPVTLPVTQPDTGMGVCGGFSEEGRYDNLPVAWSFRLCESAADSYEVQLRFRNLSERPQRFQYRVFLQSPRECVASRASGSPLLIGGGKWLRPGQVEEWPYTAGATLRRDYRGRIWSCVIPEN